MQGRAWNSTASCSCVPARGAGCSGQRGGQGPESGCTDDDNRCGCHVSGLRMGTNYSPKEVKHVLNSAREYLPISGMEWDLVAQPHMTFHPD